MVVNPAVQPTVQTQAQATLHQLILWDGNWPGATGKIADYLFTKAGTPAAQKETAEFVFDFLKAPALGFGALEADTKPVAYIIHVAGTTNIRVLYGLSPVVKNHLSPERPTLFRALMRDLTSDHDRFPGIMCLPASIMDAQTVQIPTDAFYFAKLADAAIDKTVPWCKTGSAQDAMSNTEKEDAELFKIAPVPFYTVLDGLEQDLPAAEVAERMQFLIDIEHKEYLQHALNFCKACATHYGASAKDKIPTVPAGAFAHIPSEEDKGWAIGRTTQLCPNLAVAAQPTTLSDNSTAIAAAAGLNARMLEMMKDMLAAQGLRGGQQGTGASTKDKEEEELLKNTWHGKLSMSKSGVTHLLRFCGLEEGQEHLIPKLWFRLGEKGMETVDKQREIRRVLENKKTYVDVRAPVTASLLKIIAKRDWCEGEMTITLSNIMKGLSIFAMQPLSAEEISSFDAYDECLDRASSTTVQDIAGGSSKRKHHVPSTCHGLETYIKSLVNILDAITDSGSPLADDLKFILLQLQQWDSSARAALSQAQIGTIMWVILKESRRFYNGIEKDKCAMFHAMCNHLKGQMPFSIVGLPEGLLEAKKTTKTQKEKKRGRPDDDKDKASVIDLTEGGSPPQKQRTKIKQELNPIIVDKMGSTLNKARRANLGLSQLCELVGEKIWDMFPDYCGYTTMYGKCSRPNCIFKHEMTPDAVAKKVVAKFKKVIDDPTLITGKSPTS